MPLKTSELRNFLAAILLLLAMQATGQELNCVVTINANQIQTTDRNIFRDMKLSIEQFMNTRKWTSDGFRSHEKINCSLLMTITKMPSIGVFEASVQIQAARPVFNTSYSSLTFNFADREWAFEYVESIPIEFNDNSYTSNLASLLGVYAYLILGVDYDSFSELGGSPYFLKAQQVVNNTQQSGRPGWQSIGSNRNRFWLVENYMNGQLTDIRKAFFAYHRNGMDLFDKDADKSREVILQALKDVKRIRDINPASILVISFFDAKAKELANIFSTGNLQVRREAYDIVIAIDPSNRTTYDKMVAN